MIQAAGAIFISANTKRLLLNYRAKDVKFPRSWGFIGGKIEQDEKVLQGLSREIREEIGFIPEYKQSIPMDVYHSIDGIFTYYTFAILVNDEFVPYINHESGGWGWFDLDCLPTQLHLGAKAVLCHRDFSKNFFQYIEDHKQS